jgi:DNA-binding transcriptional MerR regulator
MAASPALDPSPGAAPIWGGDNGEVIPVSHEDAVLSPAEAARRLGVSSKALRLYEQRGLVAPIRDASGWRHYPPEQMARLGEVVALRGLGLSLKAIAAVLSGKGDDLETALKTHQGRLEADVSRLQEALTEVQAWRRDLAQGTVPNLSAAASQPPALSIALPWPWSGERFELLRLAAVTYLVGPLGSGKTRLALAMAEALGGNFLHLDRGPPERLSDAATRALDWLVEDGATPTEILRALIAGMVAVDRPCIVDLIEDDLDEATQLALGAWLRQRGPDDAPLVVMTRSSAILDLEAVSQGHAVLYCPANHSPPFLVTPFPGAAGYESVAQCLGTPKARARLTHRPTPDQLLEKSPG